MPSGEESESSIAILDLAFLTFSTRGSEEEGLWSASRIGEKTLRERDSEGDIGDALVFDFDCVMAPDWFCVVMRSDGFSGEVCST